MRTTSGTDTYSVVMMKGISFLSLRSHSSRDIPSPSGRRRLGINKVEMKQIPFENLLIELNNGTIDMVTDGMYIKGERLEKALFTDVWYKEGEALVVKKKIRRYF